MTPRTDRRGMTLPELIVALTIFLVVITTALAFMAQQNAAFQTAVDRLVALRNLRYALTTLSQDLETLGTNTPELQPSLYYGGDDVVVFSADYATNVADDPFAVFHDPDAPDGQVTAPTGGFVIPNTGVSFPDTAYEATPGVASTAEVLVFFFRSDSSTARTDDYILFRQINSETPEAIARNLLRNGTEPFFGYERLGDDGTGAQALVEVPDSQRPIHHLAAHHLSAADTGASARADSVRAVVLNLAATNGRTGENEATVALTRLVALPNAGLGTLSTCGAVPLLGVGLSASPTTLTGGEPAVRLTWTQAVDEAGGESDVVRYVLWRRTAGAGSWGDPFLAIPAGPTNYSYDDATVGSGEAYEYALAAQDCTPSLSTLVTAGPVVIP